MKIQWTTMIGCALVATLAAGVSCSDDADGMGESGDGGTDEVCNPDGPTPEMGALLNAPVEDDVEVIVKTPQHPGPAGPDGLP